MTMVAITLQLPEAVERKAREAGLLSNETITAWIEAELERKREAAWKQLLEAMDQVSTHMREKYGHLSEEEAQAMIDQWISEADIPIEHTDTTAIS